MGCKGSKDVVPESWKEEFAEILSHFVSLRRLAPELLPINFTRDDLELFLSTHPKLARYVKAYLTHATTATLFLANLRRCLAAARQACASLGSSVGHFHDGNYILCLTDMHGSFSQNPFSGLVDGILDGAESHHVGQTSVARRRRRLERRVSTLRVSRKVWKVATNAAVVLVLSSSVVLAALGMPLVATTSASVASTGIKLAEQWLDALMKGREDELKEETKVVRLIGNGLVVVQELETMRVNVERVEIDLDRLVDDVDFVLGEEDGTAAKVAMEEIRRKLRTVEERMNKLEVDVESCSMQITSALSDFFRLCLQQLS